MRARADVQRLQSAAKCFETDRDAEQRRAIAAESECDVLREERDTLRAQLADAHRVLAQGETIDAVTSRDMGEKIARLERGMREAAQLLRGVRMFTTPTSWEKHAAWLREFGS